MKRLIFTLMLLICCGSYAGAQQPEKVYRTIYEEHTPAWYMVQAKVWKREVDNDRKDANAWMQYYFATYYDLKAKRNGIPMTSRSKEEWDEGRKALGGRLSVDSTTLANILSEMKEETGSTFEYRFVNWFNTVVSGGMLPHLPLLESAYTSDPDRVETFPSMITYHELNRDENVRNQFLRKWYESGDFSQGLLHYYYNVLMSVEKNAILCVEDIEAHYAILMLQNIMEVRKDVGVIWTEGMVYESYKKRIYTEYGIKETESAQTKMAKNMAVWVGPGFSVGDFISDLEYNKKGRTVYITPGIVYKSSALEKKAYLVGLAMKMSDERFDNIAVMRRNFEQSFATDYLSNTFYIERYPSVVAKCHENYIVPMLHLFDNYTLAGETEKAMKLKELIYKVGQDGIYSARIQQFMKKYEK